MMFRNRTRTGAWCLAAACLAGTSLSTFAQNIPMPPAGPAPVGQAINTGEPGRPATGEDLPHALPASMPPLDQIPPMPMSQGSAAPVAWDPANAINFVTYDAETGQAQSMVVNRAFMGVEAQGGGYAGADGLTGFETSAESMGTMQVLSDATRNVHPYRMNVKVAMRFLTVGGADAWFVCSGSMIDAETVVLAAHCVYMRDDPAYQTGYAEEIYIFPGWDGVGDPTPGSGIYQNYGYARGTYYGAGTDYVNSGSRQADVGFVGVTRAVGFLTGWYGWNYGSSCATIQSRTYNNAAYPAQFCGGSLHNGRDMTFWDGTIDSCPDNRLQIDTTTGCYTAVWGGMSGSSMYYISGTDRFISAVCSTSNRSTTAHYCRLWQGIVDFMNDTIIANTRGTTFDLQALDFNMPDTSFQQGDTFTGASALFVNATNANPALDTYTFRVYISTNATISASDRLIGTWLYNWDYAAMSSSRINTGEMQIPCDLAAGTYYIGCVLDTATDTASGNNDTSDWDAVQITISNRPAPGAPTGVIATDGTSCTGSTLTWTAPADAVSFQIWRNTVNNSATATQIGTDTASPYVDNSTVDGGRYYYWVKAVGPCGDVGPFNTSPGYGYEAAVPAATTNVAATDTSCTSVLVSWTSSAEATNYQIWRNTTSSSGTATQIADDTASPYTDATAVAGTTYFYWVRAENFCGVSGFGSSTSGVRILTPSAPTGVSATDGTNCSAVDISWNAMNFAASYQVFRNTANNSAGAAQIASVATNSYSDATAVAGTAYFYWIKASNACGQSGFSGSNQGTRGIAVGAPVNVQASDGTSCTQVDITWNPVASASSYQVWRSTSSNPASALSIGTPAGTSFSDVSAVAGTTYFYWVKAVGTCGAGAFSANNSGFRGAPPAAAPTGVTASDASACNVVLVTWNSVNGAANYQVFRNTINNSATATLLASPASTNYNDASAVANQVYFYWVKAASPCGTSGFSTPDQGTRGTTATITNQPDSRTVLPGESVTFSVVAGGLNSYQWRRNAVNLVDGPRITGSTSATLIIDPVVQGDAGDYTVVVTNACGNVTSRRAVLSVRCPADLDDGSSTGTPDGGVTIDDLLYYLAIFADGVLPADLDDGSGTGTPDGGVTIEDLLYFLGHFEAGC